MSDIWADPCVVLISDYPGDPEPEVSIFITQAMAEKAITSMKRMAAALGMTGAARTTTEFYSARGTEVMEYILIVLDRSPKLPGLICLPHGKETARIAKTLRGA